MQIKSITLEPLDMGDGDKPCLCEMPEGADFHDAMISFLQAVRLQYGPVFEAYAMWDLLTTLAECLQEADVSSAGVYTATNNTCDFKIIGVFAD